MDSVFCPIRNIKGCLMYFSKSRTHVALVFEGLIYVIVPQHCIKRMKDETGNLVENNTSSEPKEECERNNQTRNKTAEGQS